MGAALDAPFSNRARLGTEHHGGYKASGDSKPWLTWAPDSPQVLRVKGQIVDKIEEVSISRQQLITLDHQQFSYGGQYLDRKFYKWATRVGISPMILEGLKEAQIAVDRFASPWTPNHAITDVVCMANCKQIASKGTKEMSPVRFEEFSKTMTPYKLLSNMAPPPKNFAKMLKKHMDFLDDLRDGKRIVPVLQGTAYSVLRQRKQAAAVGGRGNRTLPIWATRQKRSASSQQEEMNRRVLMHDLFSAIVSNRFCATSHDRIGWVPLQAEPGDVICILNGATVPFVLRPRIHDQRGVAGWSLSRFAPIRRLLSRQTDPVDEGGYELIRECYIHGIMDGVAMRMKGLEEEIFDLH